MRPQGHRNSLRLELELSDCEVRDIVENVSDGFSVKLSRAEDPFRTATVAVDIPRRVPGGGELWRRSMG